MLWRNGCDGKVLRCGAGDRHQQKLYKNASTETWFYYGASRQVQVRFYPTRYRTRRGGFSTRNKVSRFLLYSFVHSQTPITPSREVVKIDSPLGEKEQL
jgi:hypothetical protein